MSFTGIGFTFIFLTLDTHLPSPLYIPASPTSVKRDSPGNMDLAACRVEGLVSAIHSPLLSWKVVPTLMARTKPGPRGP